MRRLAALALAVAFVAAIPHARAADDPGLVALGVGAYDFDHNQPAAEFRGEYRFAQGYYFIKPIIGGLVTTRSSTYFYGGLRADFVFFDHYVLEPNAAVGWWNRGSGKNLGSHIEFKTGAELAYRFDNAARLGLAFDHISNAGISKINPGTEQIMVMLSWPLRW